MHRSLTICNRSGLRATSNCSSTSVRGVIYIPAGHPLRMAESASTVHRYFTYATNSREEPSIPTCDQCTGYYYPPYYNDPNLYPGY